MLHVREIVQHLFSLPDLSPLAMPSKSILAVANGRVSFLSRRRDTVRSVISCPLPSFFLYRNCQLSGRKEPPFLKILRPSSYPSLTTARNASYSRCSVHPSDERGVISIRKISVQIPAVPLASGEPWVSVFSSVKWR